MSPLSALYSSPHGHVVSQAQTNGLLSVAKDHSGPTSPNSSVTGGNSLTLSLTETASPLPRNGHTRLVSIFVEVRYGLFEGVLGPTAESSRCIKHMKFYCSFVLFLAWISNFLLGNFDRF